MIINYYEILGISLNATQEQIKKAYRVNAIKYHPDKNSEDEYFTKKFIEIKEAYDCLSNISTKYEYDKLLHESLTEVIEPFPSNNTKSEYNETVREKSKNEPVKEKREDKFQYDPYKAFYSDYDRETQDTPQYPPKRFPWGNDSGRPEVIEAFKDVDIDTVFDFFILPRKIGKLVGGFSSLTKFMKKLTVWELLLNNIKSSYISVPIFAAYSIYYYFKGVSRNDINTLQESLIIFFVLSLIVILYKQYSNFNQVGFSHFNYYIGINGFAFYRFEGDKNNIVEQYEINFNDLTDLLSRQEIRKVNFRYKDTTYQFAWLNTKTGKIISKASDTYLDEKGNPDKFLYPIYWLNREAEKYWTVFLLDNMEKEIEQKGFLEFRVFNTENLSFQPYIRLGIGQITFLKGTETFTYNFNDIKRIYTKGTNLYLEHKNFEKKFFLFKSGNQDFVPLLDIGNRQFFFKAIEILLGYRIA